MSLGSNISSATCCVALSKLFNLSVLQCLHLHLPTSWVVVRVNELINMCKVLTTLSAWHIVGYCDHSCCWGVSDKEDMMTDESGEVDRVVGSRKECGFYLAGRH